MCVTEVKSGPKTGSAREEQLFDVTVFPEKAFAKSMLEESSSL